ncbi:hypothetical protein J2T57_001540 [Natronocella acetinitrilica]|uniref:DUF3375 family protein n=1 Tax=Natronocella acetinitrilica TaxID=414046 RepID=A0AAE3G3D5_9GAMM|nr:hypothetical protein [Natronocella acetinitrilica]MCP1674438.1 hypothetical protein [Natronocella acetinitrilica]
MAGDAAQTPVAGFLRLLNAHAELIESLFHQREIHVAASEQRLLAELQALRRERVVTLEGDGLGGYTVRLRTQLRALLATTQRGQRLQDVGLDMARRLETLRHLAGSWQAAMTERDAEVSETLAEQITDLIEEVEQGFGEQLEGINEQVGIRYGFGAQLTQRIRDFDLYMRRLEVMREGAQSFLDELQDESYITVTPVGLLVARMRTRFRAHGAEMARLLDELERFIHRARARQAQTRRWARQMAWLRRHRPTLDWEQAQAAASRLPTLARAPAIPLAGHPDWAGEVYSETYARLLARLRARRRKQADRRRTLEDSGSVSTTPAMIDAARAAADARQAARWEASGWIEDFLRQVVREAAAGSATGVSALDFHAARAADAPPDAFLPTPRAWLNALSLQAFMNRHSGGARFFERFELHLDPPLPRGVVTGQLQLHDLRVRLREGVIERMRRARGVGA